MKTRRKLLTVTIVAAAILSGLALGHAAAQFVFQQRVGRSLDPQAKPIAVLPERRQDLGPVAPNAALHAEFPVTNAGSRRLIISKEDDGCCGNTKSGEIIIEPGRSGILRVEVNTQLRRGAIHETVRYTTNDPDLPHFSLTVAAIVEAPPAAPESSRGA